MTKNPFLNAAAGTLYIILVSLVMFYGMSHTKVANSVVIPIAMLSLFSLSAALMGYLFLYQPLVLFLDGHKKPAVNLFLQTVAIFAGITSIVFASIFFIK